jgi:hypothetical protein
MSLLTVAAAVPAAKVISSRRHVCLYSFIACHCVLQEVETAIIGITDPG